MKRSDQLLQLLSQNANALTMPDLATALDTKTTNLWPPMQDLLAGGLAVAGSTKPIAYSITDAGREHLKSAQFGAAAKSGPKPKQPGEDQPLSIGVFTTGEIHLEANGKRMTLNQEQTRQLVNFLDAIPERVFNGEALSPRPTLATLPSRVVRHD